MRDRSKVKKTVPAQVPLAFMLPDTPKILILLDKMEYKNMIEKKNILELRIIIFFTWLFNIFVSKIRSNGK